MGVGMESDNVVDMADDMLVDRRVGRLGGMVGKVVDMDDTDYSSFAL